MTELPNLQDIKARCEAATEGPWVEDDDGGVSTAWSLDNLYGPVFIVDTEGCGMDSGNRKFIAHARTDVPALVAALEAVKREANLWKNLTVNDPDDWYALTRKGAAQTVLDLIQDHVDIGEPPSVKPADVLRKHLNDGGADD